MEKEIDISEEEVIDGGENHKTKGKKPLVVPGEAPSGAPEPRQAWDWLRCYEDYTADWEPPKVFNKWVGLLALSAATQRRVWIEEANTKFYPNLFVVLVAPSGVGKTSAMREAIPFIEQAVGAEFISPAKITAAKFIQRFSQARKMDDELGIISPYVIWAEELPSFLGADAYKTGMIADLTTLYDCPPRWEKGTKNKGDDDIVGPYPTLMGGTTAQGIFDVLPPGSVTQGFTARLLFVHATYNSKRVVIKPWTEKHIKLQAALMHDIDQVARLRGPARFSDIAWTLFTDYYMSRPAPQDEFSDSRLQGYAARKPFYVKKIALLMSVSEGNTLVIEAQHVERAMEFIGEIDLQLRKVYEEIAPSVVIQQYSRILEALRRAKENKMIRADLQRRFAYALDSRGFQEALEALEQMGWVSVATVVPTHGRTTFMYTLTDAGKRHLTSI